MTRPSLNERIQSPGPKRLLALDGGGVRGLLTLGYLARIEEILKQRSGREDFVLADYFDLIGGTSTGSIIATLLALGSPVARIRDLYVTLGHDAFRPRRSWWRPISKLLKARFDARPLEELLKSHVGDRSLSSPDLSVGLMIVAKRADTGSVWHLVNSPDQVFFAMNKDLKLWELVRSSTAAPTYFDPQSIGDVGEGEEAIFVDGGVSMHNNPALALLLAATLKGFGFRWPLGEDRMLLCSAGTGSFFKLPRKDRLRGYNNLQWIGLLINQLLDDAGELNETILQWLSNSPTAQVIDRQMGDLSGDLPGAQPLLTYLRYDIPLERKALSAVGLDYSEEAAKRLWEMSDVNNLADLEKVGIAAARAQIKPDHFPAVFDRR
jgi:hypothetical protein